MSVIVLLILSTITLVLVFVFNGLAAVGVDRKYFDFTLRRLSKNWLFAKI